MVPGAVWHGKRQPADHPFGWGARRPPSPANGAVLRWLAGALMPFQLGLPEVILVLIIALVFLGPKRLPEAGQALGKGMREFRSGLDGLNHHIDDAPPVQPPAAVYTPPPAYAPPPGDQPAVYTPPAPAAPADGTRQTESQ
jgi:sec-independent protein translocase protein TatA